MSGSASNGSSPEKDGEGIFAVQLEVMGKLLDAERRKMSLLQSELPHHTARPPRESAESGSALPPSGSSPLSTQDQPQQKVEAVPVGRTIQGEAIVRQRQNISRLQEQHDRLEIEYRTAAAGMFRKRSSSSAPKARSQPAIGMKVTPKQRPSIFTAALSLDDGDAACETEHGDRDDKRKVHARKGSNLAASFVDAAGRGNRLSVVMAESSSVEYKNGRLVSGKLDDLIEHLIPTDKHYPDRTYLFAFLLCSRLFVKPHELMAKVARQFRSVVGTLPGATHGSRSSSTSGDTSPGDSLSSSPVQPSTMPLALRPGVMETAKNMVQFLSEWTESFAYDFREEKMMRHLKEITQACASLSPAIRQSVGQVTSVVIKRLAVLDQYENMLDRADLAMAEKQGQEDVAIDITELCPSPSVLAQQLTHIELERLTHIGAEEFIQAFVSEESASSAATGSTSEVKQTRNLEAYVEWFNRLSNFVAMEVCCSGRSKDKKKQRAKVIEYFIDVANECCHLNNFNSLMAIAAGLNMTPVSRLKKTWAKVNMTNNEMLDAYCDPSGNFNYYRQSLLDVMSMGQVQDESFCVIPFFSLLVKDIYFLNQAMKRQTTEKHVNFEKCWQLAKLVTQFMSWKQVACDFERSRPVLNYLMTTPLPSETELFLASFDLEAPESAYEKERCKALRSSNPQLVRSGSKRKRR